MKNFIFPITIAFLLSLLIHYLFYDRLNETLNKDRLHINTSNKKGKGKKGFTSIKYVKLQKPSPKIEPQKPKPKPIQKIVKKKKLIKKSPLIKKVKTINLPKAIKKNNLKNLFTLSKQEIQKEKEEKRRIKKEIKELQKLDPQTQQYIKLYGDQYFSYSKEQRKYLKQNLSSIGRITQRYLKYPALSGKLGQHGMNIVEFTLHPNGDISDLKLVDGSNYTMLDKNSIETIELAYKDYPKPLEPTVIRIFIKYILY